MTQFFLVHLLLLLPPLLSATTLLSPHGHVTVRVPLPKKLLKPSSNFTSLSITATSSSYINDGSILFSAFHGGFLNYWSLDANEQLQGASKELCELPAKKQGGEVDSASYVSVAAFSTSSTELAVQFNATWEDTELQLGRQKNLSLRTGSSKVKHVNCPPNQPIQVLYHPPSSDYNQGESYLLSLSSPTEDCFLVAIRFFNISSSVVTFVSIPEIPTQ